MAKLTIHRKQLLKVGLPYWVCINGQPVVIMQGREVSIQMPPGRYELGVWLVFRLLKRELRIGGSREFTLSLGEHQHLRVTDNERLWNVLFDIDLVLWLAEFFITLPHPWHTVYEVLSNGFFILWMARIWFIRKRYFRIVEQAPNKQA